MTLDILKVFAIVCVAFVCGKIISKIKMPAILGWLIARIVFGPYLVGLVDFTIIESGWYENTVSAFECCAGLMIGFAVGIAITAGLLMRKKSAYPLTDMRINRSALFGKLLRSHPLFTLPPQSGNKMALVYKDENNDEYDVGAEPCGGICKAYARIAP